MKYRKVKLFFALILAISFFSFFSSPAHAGTIGKPPYLLTLTSGLVGHWTFDGRNTPNGKLLDISGNSNNGSPISIATSTFYAMGKIGQGVSFDGVDDNVRVPDNVTLDVSTQFTISLWGNQKVVVEGGGLVNKFVDSAGNRSYDVYSSGTDEIAVFISSNGSTRELDVSVNDCGFTSNNTWTHILVTYNAGTINYYNNGIVCDTDANAITSIFDSPSQVMFGLNNDGDYFNGTLDDVRIYNRALSAAEITQLYNFGAAKQNVTATRDHLRSGLVGHWTFDGKDMPNGVARDVSGQGNNGNTVSIATSTFYALGKIGQGLKFDGVDDAISLTAAPSNINATTISLWIKPDSVFSGTIYRESSSVSNTVALSEHEIRVTSAGVTYFNGDGSASDSDAFAVTINGGVWSHIVCTLDESDNKLCYFNGTLISSATNSVDISLNPAVIALIGTNRVTAGQNFFEGLIDDVRIYNRALSATEITQLYNLGAAKVGVSVSPEGLKSGLVGHWTFDGKDMPGGRANDVSGQGNHGSLTNIATSTFYARGKLGQGLQFDGVDDYVEITETSGLPIYTMGGTNSVAMWVNGPAADSQTLFAEGNSSGGNTIYSIIKDNTICVGSPVGSICVQIRNTAGSTLLLTPSVGVVFDNTWHHIVWVDNAGTATMYIDGVADARNFNYTPSGTVSSNRTCLGALCRGTVGTFGNVKMDDVRVYNRALSATEVTQLYNLGR